MEWTMPVNEIFDEEVTKISATFLPKNFSSDVRTTRTVQEQIAKLIDTLGEESASSQGLNKVITSAEKLRSNPTHTIYLLKDHRAFDGKGEIIGLLKVGRKHLFLFDDKQVVHEVEPLCVLDFYIVRDRQRMGFGRMLFDFMLHELEVTADQLAIDGPSDKMEQFLARNFGINKLMRQNNNFAVAHSFFDRTDAEISNRAGDATVAPAAAVGRFAAPKPTSAIANVIHGAHDEPARRSPSPTAAQPGAAAAAAEEPGAADPPARQDFHGWEDEYRSEPDLDDDVYERYAFEPEQPGTERRGPVRYRATPALERPASLPVQRGARPVPSAPPAEPAAVLAAGMPSGGASAAHSAAGTPAGSGRRDSQLTDKGYFDVKYYHNRLCSSPAAAAEPCAVAALAATEAAADVAEAAADVAEAAADVSEAAADVAEAAADVAEADVAGAVAAVAEARQAAAADAEAAAKASAATALPVDPYAGEYGFEDYEYPSSPELDDDEYERYSFDPDQPAWERRDENRARGNRYN